jgi:hypothetical protein
MMPQGFGLQGKQSTHHPLDEHSVRVEGDMYKLQSFIFICALCLLQPLALQELICSVDLFTEQPASLSLVSYIHWST